MTTRCRSLDSLRSLGMTVHPLRSLGMTVHPLRSLGMTTASERRSVPRPFSLSHSPTHKFSILPLVLVIAAAVVIVVAEDAERATDVGGDVGVVRLIETDRRRIDRRAALRLEPA